MTGPDRDTGAATPRTAQRAGATARVCWIALGGLSLALGAIGVLLPLLPTAPFVILAAFAFSKSSDRLAGALNRHRHFGPMIDAWRAEGAIAPRHKAAAVSMMIAALAASVFLGVGATIVAVQAAVMAAAAAFILSRPNGTKRRHGRRASRSR
ncbi:YbaN family protein [Citreimonas salinaria]|uniref:DUF454 domain-containing protein n=1 Tax=Citreimonas salinaria TaxID=321339 RepID=A0A1H3NZJ6_9RHOB|nr:YbaN family protein [Citreimonas salinaria]SDY94191.1 hypothetical protein SAMN05444340_1395 [Citreimonas salinaria]